MAISRKKEFARMIAMMVRKESVAFEPYDRVPLDLKKNSAVGDPVRLEVGEVYYDFDSGRMSYSLFTADGAPVTRAAGPLFLDEDLTSAELSRVGAKVADYVEKSISRSKNMADIQALVFGIEDMVVSLDDKPRISVDLKGDGNVEMVEPGRIFIDPAVHKEARTVMLSGTSDGKDFNFPLEIVSDMGLANVLAKVRESVKQEIKKEKADFMNISEDLAIEIVYGGDRFDREDLFFILRSQGASVKDLDGIRKQVLNQVNDYHPGHDAFYKEQLDYWLDPERYQEFLSEGLIGKDLKELSMALAERLVVGEANGYGRFDRLYFHRLLVLYGAVEADLVNIKTEAGEIASSLRKDASGGADGRQLNEKLDWWLDRKVFLKASEDVRNEREVQKPAQKTGKTPVKGVTM